MPAPTDICLCGCAFSKHESNGEEIGCDYCGCPRFATDPVVRRYLGTVRQYSMSAGGTQSDYLVLFEAFTLADVNELWRLRCKTIGSCGQLYSVVPVVGRVPRASYAFVAGIGMCPPSTLGGWQHSMSKTGQRLRTDKE